MSLTLLLSAPNLYAHTWDILLHKSLGKDAVDFNRNGQFTTFTNTVLVDGAITSLPTEAVTYDRTLLNFADIAGVIPISDKISLRLDLMSQFAMRVEEGAEEPRKISRETWVEVYPRMGFTFLTQSNLEVFLGLTYAHIGAFERRIESEAIETVWSYEDVLMAIPHVGITKRTGSFEGGFYYKLKAEKSRSITKYTSQDESNLEFEDRAFDPTIVALFFQGKFGEYKLFTEFAAVQASDGGDTTDTGEKVMEDYTLARLMGYFPINPAVFNLRLFAMHKTLSYADNRNVTLSTIPMTSVHLQFLRGPENSNTYIGLIYATGKDGQSLPEFNAKYDVKGYGVTAGLHLAF